MATDLERLVVSLSADIKSYEKSLARATGVTTRELRKMEGQMLGGAKRIEAGMARFGGAFKAGLIGALGGIGIDRAIRGIFESVDKLNDIGEIAGRTGFTTNLVQGFQELGREATAEIENVNKALQAFSEQAATADSFLDKLFKANDRKIDLKDPQKNLQTFMDLVKNAGSAAEQLRIVTGVVGDRAGRELTEAFARGGSAVQDAFRKMENSGRAHSAVQIEEAGKIKAKFVEVSADIESVWEKLAVTIGTPLVGALDTFSEDLKKVIGDLTTINDLINNGEFKKALDVALFGQQTGPAKFNNSSQSGALAVSPKGNRETPTVIPKTGGGSTNGDAERAESDRIKRLIDFSIEQQQRAADIAEKIAKDQLELDQELYDSKLALAQITMSAFEAIIIGGEKAEDVIKNLAQSLLQAATQAALFGQGPFASLFGTSASGGIFGNLFNKPKLYAKGGQIPGGQVGIAGEAGPELIQGPANVIPFNKLRGGGSNVQIIDQRTNAPAVEQQRGSDGSLKFIIRDAVNDIIGSGQADSALRNRHGLTPQKARR